MRKKTILTMMLLLGTSFLLYKTVASIHQQHATGKPIKTIYLAGGCFWGTQHFFKQVKGVIHTEVGYANGKVRNPSYRMVCTEDTGFAETVKVAYDSSKISLNALLELFYQTINPFSINKQGNDEGTQYRTGIYFTDTSDSLIINRSLQALSQRLKREVAIEQKALSNYYRAEEYHQDYLKKHPNGYCHISKDLFRLAKATHISSEQAFRKKSEQELKKELTPLQLAVTQRNATEPAFKNEYWNEFRQGIYVDITTGEPLFISTDKFDSGCGWPSFSKPIHDSLLVRKQDLSHGMQRVEVRSKKGNAHLGHVFQDGPKANGGLRYCINSASLKFVPKEKMKQEGYEKYMQLFNK